MGTFWNNIGGRIKTGGGNVWKLIKTSVGKWWGMDPFRQSAIIAYYAIFSLPALLVIIVSIAGLAFGADVVNGKIIEQISGTMGPDTAEQIRVMLAKASDTKTSVWATIVGIVTVILGSLGVFLELQKSLNIIWEVEEKPKKGVWGFLRARVFSFGLILSIAFMLMVSLVISTGLAAASEYLKADSSQALALLFEGINMIISVGVISLLFALMFKFLPDTQIKWRHVWVGSLVTGVLFTIGKTLLAFYFGKADPGSGYGAAGSIILILLWVNYSSMILFLGAEFTHTYADMREPGKKDDQKSGKNETKANDSETEQEKTNYSVLRAVPFVLPLIALINYTFPFLLPFIAKRVARKYNATLSIRRISIGLFKPIIAIKELTLRYGNTEDKKYMAFANIKEISLNYNRKAFFNKQIDINSIFIHSPEIQIAWGKKNEISVSNKQSQPVQSTIDPFPVILRRFSLEGGKIGYENSTTTPVTALSANSIDIFVAAKEMGIAQEVDYAVEIEGRLLGGLLKSAINLRANFKKPTFDLKLELASIDLSQLNSFFKAYARVDVHKGNLDVFSEVSVVQNSITGYIKPLIKDLKIVGPEDQHKNLVSRLKEGAIGFVKETLENQRHDQVATEIPFEGKLNDPHIKIAHALFAVGVNIFIHALKPDFSTLPDGNAIEDKHKNG